MFTLPGKWRVYKRGVHWLAWNGTLSMAPFAFDHWKDATKYALDMAIINVKI